MMNVKANAAKYSLQEHIYNMTMMMTYRRIPHASGECVAL